MGPQIERCSLNPNGYESRLWGFAAAWRRARRRWRKKKRAQSCGQLSKGRGNCTGRGRGKSYRPRSCFSMRVRFQKVRIGIRQRARLQSGLLLQLLRGWAVHRVVQGVRRARRGQSRCARWRQLKRGRAHGALKHTQHEVNVRGLKQMLRYGMI